MNTIKWGWFKCGAFKKRLLCDYGSSNAYYNFTKHIKEIIIVGWDQYGIQNHGQEVTIEGCIKHSGCLLLRGDEKQNVNMLCLIWA